jgi:chitinase
MLLFISCTALLASLRGVYAGFDPGSASNIAVYWGQNSYGAESGSLGQQRLSHYCENTDISIIPISFLTAFNGPDGQPTVNIANADKYCSSYSHTQIFDCPQLAQDIETCQKDYSKTILLSIGGVTYTAGGFSSDSAAIAGANLVWATFGPQRDGSSAHRPFGSSAVDGFDLDFEKPIHNMAPFANQLRSLMDADTADTGRKWLLTAAPQCPYPDAVSDTMLDGVIAFDAIFIQFYNNPCGLPSFFEGATAENDFDFSTWDDWAKVVSKNPSIKILLGVPAAKKAARIGYEPSDKLAKIIEYCKQFKSFGGVMMWDATQAYANKDFLDDVASSLAERPSRIKGWRSWSA